MSTWRCEVGVCKGIIGDGEGLDRVGHIDAGGGFRLNLVDEFRWRAGAGGCLS